MKRAGNIINEQLCWWVSSGEAALSFGDYFKVVEFITPKTPPVNVNIIVRVISHRRKIQASIVPIELQIVHNPNMKLYWGKGKYKERELKQKLGVIFLAR